MNSQKEETESSFDYSVVPYFASIAIYDNLKAAPRVIKVEPAPTTEFIEALASSVYEQSMTMGGAIPYTVIREVAENFIHAQFKEIVVSILDKGNTIRFADQGPGIKNKEKAQLPGFTSATSPMKDYIRGVGSGLPIVKEYLSFSAGSISIEDNLSSGAVVTISLNTETEPSKPHGLAKSLIPTLSPREKVVLPLFLKYGALGITDIVRLTEMAQSTVYNTLSHLEENGLIENTTEKKRILTELGYKVAQTL